MDIAQIITMIFVICLFLLKWTIRVENDNSSTFAHYDSVMVRNGVSYSARNLRIKTFFFFLHLIFII